MAKNSCCFHPSKRKETLKIHTHTHARTLVHTEPFGFEVSLSYLKQNTIIAGKIVYQS